MRDAAEVTRSIVAGAAGDSPPPVPAGVPLRSAERSLAARLAPVPPEDRGPEQLARQGDGAEDVDRCWPRFLNGKAGKCQPKSGQSSVPSPIDRPTTVEDEVGGDADGDRARGRGAREPRGGDQGQQEQAGVREQVRAGEDPARRLAGR